MVRKFGVRNIDNILDDTDTERLGEESIHNRQPDRIRECLVEPTTCVKYGRIRYP